MLYEQNLREIQTQNLADQMGVAFREAGVAVGGQFDPSQVHWGKVMSVPSEFKKLREAVAESAFPSVLRAGVQALLFDAYQSVGVVYPDLVRVVSSNKFEELYAPLYGAELPKQVRPGQGFEDSRLQGLDVRVQNIKFGRILAIERELVDDDQTGQIQQKASQMGQRMRYVEEQTVMDAITGATYTVAIGNRVATPARLTQALIEEATILMHQMKDPLGNLILVQPDTLLVSPADEFNAAKLLQSALQPSVPGSAGQDASTASSGGTGWTMTMNPLQGLFALKVSRFLTSTAGLDSTHGAALLLQSKTSVVWQDRDPLEVTPEAQNAGESFDHDVLRWRVRRRGAAAVVEPRYLCRVN